MRFLSMIWIDEKTAKAPTEQLMADMGKLMEEITQAGVLIDIAGLRPTSEGRNQGSQRPDPLGPALRSAKRRNPLSASCSQ